MTVGSTTTLDEAEGGKGATVGHASSGRGGEDDGLARGADGAAGPKRASLFPGQEGFAFALALARALALALAGGFGVTSTRHDERAAKTPWWRTSGK